ncbi:unnamed protein product, partial [Amoebophrya sp. A25]
GSQDELGRLEALREVYHEAARFGDVLENGELNVIYRKQRVIRATKIALQKLIQEYRAGFQRLDSDGTEHTEVSAGNAFWKDIVQNRLMGHENGVDQGSTSEDSVGNVASGPAANGASTSQFFASNPPQNLDDYLSRFIVDAGVYPLQVNPDSVSETIYVFSAVVQNLAGELRHVVEICGHMGTAEDPTISLGMLRWMQSRQTLAVKHGLDPDDMSIDEQTGESPASRVDTLRRKAG